MSKKRKTVPTLATEKGSRIPTKAMSAPTRASTENMHPKLSFRHVDPRRWTLEQWHGQELADLIRCFQKVEELTWAQIRNYKGLGYQKVNEYPEITHCNLSEDVCIHEMRVSGVKRIYGYRDPQDGTFCIIWFDRTHEICAEGKNVRYN